MVVLYSNHCARCNVVKAKLDEASIKYTLVDDLEWLSSNGYDLMPVLEVDGEKLTNMTQMNEAIARLSSCLEEQEK